MVVDMAAHLKVSLLIYVLEHGVILLLVSEHTVLQLSKRECFCFFRAVLMGTHWDQKDAIAALSLNSQSPCYCNIHLNKIYQTQKPYLHPHNKIVSRLKPADFISLVRKLAWLFMGCFIAWFRRDIPRSLCSMQDGLSTGPMAVQLCSSWAFSCRFSVFLRKVWLGWLCATFGKSDVLKLNATWPQECTKLRFVVDIIMPTNKSHTWKKVCTNYTDGLCDNT